MRRLAALAAATALAAAALIGAATPADAACRTAGYSNNTAYTSAGHQVRVKTFWVDCGSYKRLQSAKWYMPVNTSAHNVELRYWHSAYVYVLVNSTKVNTSTVDLGNVACIETCGTRHSGNLWVGYSDIISYGYTNTNGF
jgi:hypothetical protein